MRIYLASSRPEAAVRTVMYWTWYQFAGLLTLVLSAVPLPLGKRLGARREARAREKVAGYHRKAADVSPLTTELFRRLVGRWWWKLALVIGLWDYVVHIAPDIARGKSDDPHVQFVLRSPALLLWVAGLLAAAVQGILALIPLYAVTVVVLAVLLTLLYPVAFLAERFARLALRVLHRRRLADTWLITSSVTFVLAFIVDLSAS